MPATQGPLAPTTPDAVLSGQSVASLEKSKNDAIETSRAVEVAADKKLHADEAEFGQKQEALEGERRSLTPPKLEIPPQPVPKATDPTHVWGSAAMLLAGIGSLMTRRPLLTAMNAATGVLQAYRKGDQEAADAGYRTWEVATKNAIEINRYQTDVYKEALRDVEHREDVAEKGTERREKLTTDEAARIEKEAMAEFTANAHAFSDETALKRAQEEGALGIQRLIVERERLNKDLEEVGPKLLEAKAFQDAYGAIQKTPEWQKASPIDRFKMIHGLLAKTAPSMDNRGDGSAKDLRSAEAAYKTMYPKGPDGNPLDPSAPKFEDFYNDGWKDFGGGPGPTSALPQWTASKEAAPWFRDLTGVGVRVTSATRTPGQNAAVKGVNDSSHKNGYGYDLAPMTGELAPLAQKVKAQLDAKGIPYDQIIIEYPGADHSTGPHVHVSFDPQFGYRKQFLQSGHAPAPAGHPAAAPATHAPAPPAAHAGGLPAGLPAPTGHAEGSVLKKGGKVVAVLRNGQWATP